MTQFMTLAIVIASAVNPPDYKHPFAAVNKKKDRREFSTTSGAHDYKHPNKRERETKREFVNEVNGANSAASTKHPLGL
jgi:hypothetical protein